MPRQPEQPSRLGPLAWSRTLALHDRELADLEPQVLRDLERLPGEGVLPGVPSGPQRPNQVLGRGVDDDPPSLLVDVEGAPPASSTPAPAGHDRPAFSAEPLPAPTSASTDAALKLTRTGRPWTTARRTDRIP